MRESESESEFEREQEEAAAAEARGIGGSVSYRDGVEDDEPDPAQMPLIEAGEGESEGFELAEQELEEHASHGDMHSARRVLEDASRQDEDSRAVSGGEGDAELSSELDED
jgi:glutamate synthase domain-containing protein 3